MSSVFRKRYLRSRDVLDPDEMNQDFQSYADLYAGNITGHHIDAADLRNRTGEPGYPKLNANTHLKHDYASVICELPRIKGGLDADHQPNFLNEFMNAGDGTPTAESERDAYQLYEGSVPQREWDYFYQNVAVVGKNSGWTPLPDGVVPNIMSTLAEPIDDEAESSVTTESLGEVDLWINAQVQYLRNGWGRTFDSFLDPALGSVAAPERDDDNPGLEAYPTGSALENGVRFVCPIKMEVVNPSRAASAHMSMGHNPADIQFAIRVDGQILEDTITGKRNTHSRTPIGMRNIESRMIDKDAVHIDGDDGKSEGTGASSAAHLPGDTSPSVRVAALGPECSGTRLSTITRVGSGKHKIEIVARRLGTVDGSPNLPSDAVAVLTRQISVVSISRDVHKSIGANPTTIPHFDAEDLLNLRDPTIALEDALNDVREDAVIPNTLTYEHLNSIVAFYSVKTGTPIPRTQTKLHPDDNWFGWKALDTLHSADLGGTHATSDSIAFDQTGWNQMAYKPGDTVKAFSLPTWDTASLARGIGPEVTDEDLFLVFADFSVDIYPSGTVPMMNRLLDQFAHFCIGHREFNETVGGSSAIGPQAGLSKTWRFDRTARAHVNSINWIYREAMNLSIVAPSDSDYDGGDAPDGVMGTAGRDRRYRYGMTATGPDKGPDCLSVSLMFVLDGKTMKTPPTNPIEIPLTSEASAVYDNWTIGEFGLFACGTACGGQKDGSVTGNAPRNYHDAYWEVGGVPTIGGMFQVGGTFGTGYSFQYGGESYSHTIYPPTLKYDSGKCSFNMIRLRRGSI